MGNVYILSNGKSMLDNYGRVTNRQDMIKDFIKENRESIMLSKFKGKLNIPEYDDFIDEFADFYIDYREKHNETDFLKNSSAEISSVLNSREISYENDKIYLLCSDTPDGILSGYCNARLFRDLKICKNIRVDIIKNLDVNDKEFVKSGLNNLMKKVVEINYSEKEKDYKVIINISGSFKVISGYLLYIGMLMGIPIEYGYIGNQLIKLPSFPVGYSHKILEKCNLVILKKFYKKEEISNNEWEILRRQADENIEYLREEKLDEDGINISQLGRILLEEYLSSIKAQLTRNLFSKEALTSNFNRIVEYYGDISDKFCLAMFDLDHFKNINDEHGHNAGDEVLKEFSKILVGKMSSEEDKSIIFRWGGEEFLVMFPTTSQELSSKILEGVRKKLANKTMNLGNEGKKGNITTSIGATIVDTKSIYFDDKNIIDDIVKRADKLLYKSKDGGRNRLTIDYFNEVSKSSG